MNDINTDVNIRIFHWYSSLLSFKLHGHGGMVESKGTSKEEAYKNQSLRQEIASHADIISLFNTYTLDEGFIVIGHMTTIRHVRTLLNDFKKDKEKSDIFFVSFNG